MGVATGGRRRVRDVAAHTGLPVSATVLSEAAPERCQVQPDPTVSSTSQPRSSVSCFGCRHRCRLPAGGVDCSCWFCSVSLVSVTHTHTHAHTRAPIPHLPTYLLTHKPILTFTTHTLRHGQRSVAIFHFVPSLPLPLVFCGRSLHGELAKWSDYTARARRIASMLYIIEGHITAHDANAWFLNGTLDDLWTVIRHAEALAVRCSPRLSWASITYSPVGDGEQALVHSLQRLLRSFHHARQSFLRAHGGVETGAHAGLQSRVDGSVSRWMAARLRRTSGR